MTKKRNNQEFIKGDDYMAYITGAQAAREAVKVMAELVQHPFCNFPEQ